MKRKVIQIGDSTQLISLPRKWAQGLHIKKGDELDLEPKGNTLIVTTKKESVYQTVDVDISNLDKSSIVTLLRSLYIKGVDEIRLHFSQPFCEYYTTQKSVKIMTVIRETLDRLVGIVIIDQKDALCVIKGISESSTREFEVILRRIFLLLIDMVKDLGRTIRQKDPLILDAVYEKHDTITRFVAYCLRILNQLGYYKPEQVPFLFSLLSDIDTLVDLLRHSAQELGPKLIVHKSTEKWLSVFTDVISGYHNFFYRYTTQYCTEMHKARSELRVFMMNDNPQLSNYDLRFLGHLQISLELLRSMTESRIALQSFDETINGSLQKHP